MEFSSKRQEWNSILLCLSFFYFYCMFLILDLFLVSCSCLFCILHIFYVCGMFFYGCSMGGRSKFPTMWDNQVNTEYWTATTRVGFCASLLLWGVRVRLQKTCELSKTLHIIKNIYMFFLKDRLGWLSKWVTFTVPQLGPCKVVRRL